MVHYNRRPRLTKNDCPVCASSSFERPHSPEPEVELVDASNIATVNTSANSSSLVNTSGSSNSLFEPTSTSTSLSSLHSAAGADLSSALSSPLLLPRTNLC